MVALSRSIQLTNWFVTLMLPGPTTPFMQAQTVWADPRSLATTSGIISVPPGNKMFQFPGFPSSCLCVQHEIRKVHLRGFPHSDIYGL